MDQRPAQNPLQSKVAAGCNVFRLEGEYWTVAYDGVVCRFRDCTGLNHLAYLFSRPGQRVAAAELVRASRTSQRRAANAGGRRPLPEFTKLTNADTERSRVTVTRAIRTAMQRIGVHNAALITHLKATIKTGTFCAYAPDPRLPITWEL